jgi:hypothetical protein
MSNTKTTLILGDIHHRVDQADEIIRHVKADEVISIGDAFDDFVEDPEVVRHTAEWFVDFVNQPNHIFIAGNHEMHYAFANRSFVCSGYQQWKYFQINDIVSRKDWNKMVYYHILDGKWLLSHAGLHNLHVPPEIVKLHTDRPKFLAELSTYLDAQIIEGHRNNSWIFGAGHSRGGDQRVGGITWNDFEREFYPVKGLNQIFGHTSQGLGFAKWCVQRGDSKPEFYPVGQFQVNPTMIDNVNISVNIDLDVHRNIHWATWNGKKLKVFNYKDDL